MAALFSIGEKTCKMDLGGAQADFSNGVADGCGGPKGEPRETVGEALMIWNALGIGQNE